MNATEQPTIHVNHLGFRPDDPLKRAVMPADPSDTGFLGARLFEVTRVSDFIQYALNSPENIATMRWYGGPIEDTPLGRFVVCEFSDLEARGGYQLQCGSARSYPFLIYRDLWKRCFRLLLEWYRIAACGEAVPGYHERCHLDDCRLPDGRQVDLVGGWHDAGDLRKWTTTMARASWYLAELVAEHAGHLDQLGVDEDLVWHQLRRGTDYLFKTVDPVSHLVWHDVASNGDNRCNVWTDNRPNTGDERLAGTHTPPYAAYAYIQAQSALAKVWQNRDRALAERARSSALEVWDAAARQFHPDQKLSCALSLWQTTRRDDYRDLAGQVLRQMLDRQVTGPSFGQDRLRGFFVREGQIEGNEEFRHRGGRNLFELVRRGSWLARALIAWPKAPDAPRWREALNLLLEGCVEPMLRLSPYRALPSCIFARGETELFGRPLAGDLVFRYFPHAAEGHNYWLANAAARLALCARALDQPRWAAYAQKQLEWIMGFNPAETSMMTGLGYSQAAVFSFYVGQIPGAVINGFLGGPADEPMLCLNREVSPMNMEYWSVSTAAMLRALARLENQPLS